MSKKSPKPSLTIFAGPNGSGKTTVTRHIRSAGIDFGVLINADDLAAELAKSKGELSASLETQMQAAKRAEALRWDHLDLGKSFCSETVMSDEARWLAFFTAAQQKGFFVQLIFVTTNDPEINVLRVADRVSKGGHHVDRDKIIQRYNRVMDSVLPKILPLVDRAILYDNSNIVAAARRVLTYQSKRLEPAKDVDSLPEWAKTLIKRCPS